MTQQVYEKGTEAAKRLAITGKPVEVVCIIPKERVMSVSEDRHVEAILGADGSEIRPGSGTEQYTTGTVEVKELSWLSLAVP
ncbi:MAG: hypothetical protein HYX80_01145 [Chloroflexi bacterium]|nr:hypothetical protein [Chloroflexota bacterium]